MSPVAHIPCPVCGATVADIMPRCRYCGELIGGGERQVLVPVASASRDGISDHALLVALAGLALPGQAALAQLTPPYQVPDAAIAVVPMGSCAVVLGFLLGAVWLPQRTWILAPALAFVLHGITTTFVLSWRRMVLPLDLDLWPIACAVGAAALIAAVLGRGAGWLWRRGAEERR